mmetsp:Transcript_36571/g.49001  ORF Transcript_36571/g.49001 Transcript_36571/m.49001 type:complete len:625 (+) Transcript_36571:72-1946(+)
MANGDNRTSPRPRFLFQLLFAFTLFFVAMLNFNIISNFGEYEDSLSIPSIGEEKHPFGQEKSPNHHKQEKHSDIAGLSCGRYGGPSSKEITSEMVYWRDIPTDAEYVSPYRHHDCWSSSNEEGGDGEKHDKQRNAKCPTKYISYELDPAGWNNRRMNFEIVVAIALATGRTLVLSPKSIFPMLMEEWYTGNGTSAVHNDFYPLDSLSKEYKGLDIISMEEFLKREGLTGNLAYTNKTLNELLERNKKKTNLDRSSNEKIVQFPPGGNQTEWEQSNYNDGSINLLWGYLRLVGFISQNWNPLQCIGAFAANPGNESASSLKTMIDDTLREREDQPRPKPEDLHGKKVSVDASPKERLRNMLAGREISTTSCVYDADMQDAKLIHFDSDIPNQRRLFGHFYAFLFFEDWKVDLLVKRTIRDHLRYRDEIMCAAARIVEALRNRSKARNSTQNSSSGTFDTFHIRRGDFLGMYQWTNVGAKEIFDTTKDVLTPNSTIFIATDEKNITFFEPLKKHYDILFLDDFKDLLIDLKPTFYGMVDQLVAARGRTFVGVSYSTYSGYINRLRGYYSTKEKLEGYKGGVLNSYYYSKPNDRNEMRVYHDIEEPIWKREFPLAWVDIDQGTKEIE